MFNDKNELFNNLGIVSNESIADIHDNQDVEYEEISSLEAVEADLKELSNIEESHDNIEKASFECIVSDLETLGNVIAYRDVALTKDKTDAYFESLSSELNISTEGIKDTAKKGVSAIKSLIDRLIAALKRIFGASQTQEKVIKSLDLKIKSAKSTDGKYDLKLFALVTGREMILAGMSNKGFSPSDFPNTLILKPVTTIANNAVKGFYANSTKSDQVHSALVGNLSEITKGISDIEAASKDVTSDTEEFNYQKNALKLVSAFRRYNVSKAIKEMISSLEKRKAEIDKKMKGKQSVEEYTSNTETAANLKSILSTINAYKDINSKNIRLLVQLCGQFLSKPSKSSNKDEKTA